MRQKASPYLTAVACWAAIISLGIFANLAIWPGVSEMPPEIDRQILAWLSTIRSPTLDRFFMVITWAGSNVLLLPLTVVVAIRLSADRQIRDAVFLGSATVGASLLANLGKYLIARPRPILFPALIDIQSGHSFPSGHATQITAFVLASLWLLKRSTTAPWLIVSAIAGGGLIALVCFSRLYLQVHYPSDVWAGALTATFWVIGLANLTITSSRPNSTHQTP